MKEQTAKLKRILMVFLILPVILLGGCSKEELYYISSDSNKTEKSANAAIPGYEYRDYEKVNAVTAGECTWYSMTQRGILFLPNNGILTIYNPESGTLNTLCPDPLCSHQPFSGCPYGNCIFTNSIPIAHDGRFYYFVKDQYTDNDNSIISFYKIYSTDYTGQKIWKHYEGSNYMYGLAVCNDCAYFLESQDENYNLIKSVNLSTGAENMISAGDDDHLVIESFICLNDRIYFILDNGRIYSCNPDLNDISFEYDAGRLTAIYGRKDMNSVFWRIGNVIYQYDADTKTCSNLVEVDEESRIERLIVEDEGLYYQVFPAETSYGMTYREFADSISGHNDLYFIDPLTGAEASYALPDSLYLMPNAATVCRGLLICQTCIENDFTQMLAGSPFYAYELSTGYLYLVTDVKGS